MSNPSVIQGLVVRLDPLDIEAGAANHIGVNTFDNVSKGRESCTVIWLAVEQKFGRGHRWQTYRSFIFGS